MPMPEDQKFDTELLDTQMQEPVITSDHNMLGVPGVLVEFDPDEADAWGAVASDPREVASAWEDAIADSGEQP